MITRRQAQYSLGATLIALAVIPWAVTSATADSASGSPGDHKVTICHRTASDTNPYVVITVDTDAAGGGKDMGAGDHAAEHQGPVWNNTLKDQHIEWGDIIPPYVDDQGVSFPGLNWSAAGQAIYNNGCAPLGPSPTTSSAPVTTTPPATTTSAPITTASSGSVTTSSAATGTTTASVSVLPTKATASTGTGSTGGGAGGSGSSPDTAVQGTKTGTLAHTGPQLSTVQALGLSLLMILIGTGLLLAPGWTLQRERRH